MGLITDEKANAASLMNQLKVICNGEKTGRKCKHYWGFKRKINANNAVVLKEGETLRNCTLLPGYLVEFDGHDEMPHTCDRYKPSFFRKYDSKLEEYNPLTPEESKEIENAAHENNVDDLVQLGVGSGLGVPGMTSVSVNIPPKMLRMLTRGQTELFKEIDSRYINEICVLIDRPEIKDNIEIVSQKIKELEDAVKSNPSSYKPPEEVTVTISDMMLGLGATGNIVSGSAGNSKSFTKQKSSKIISSKNDDGDGGIFNLEDSED